jgi:lauroyl/myristoyl acyltransferase
LIPSPAVIRAATALLRVIPVPVARALAAAGGTLAWMIQGDRRRVLLENLARTASDQPIAMRRRLARRTFRNFADVVVDQFRLPSMTPEEARALFEIRGLEHVEAAQARGRGTVMVTAHLGPYELAAATFTTLGYTVYGMMEDLPPEVLEALASYRSATGMHLLNVKDGLRAAYRVLGEGHILALVADRVIGDTRGVMELPFAGGVRLLPTGPAVFAQGTGAAIVTAFATPHPARHKGGPRYAIDFDAPIVAEGRDETERRRLMLAIVERMTVAIRRNPDYWFVFQPNWITREPD